MLIDAHCHVFPEDYPEGLDKVVQRMLEAGVDGALVNAVNHDSAVAAAGIATEHPVFWATAGVHPEDPEEREITDAEFQELLAHPKCVAVGEIGLDYYWVQGDRKWQRERFRRQLEIAKKADLPAVVHTRNAPRDTLDLIRESGLQNAQIHCCTENVDFVREALDLGCHISFTGIVTFKKADVVRESCAFTPIDRLLLETDSPYLAPVPKRGKRNEPAYVAHVADFVAELRGTSPEALAEATSANFFALFKKAAATSSGKGRSVSGSAT